MESRSADVRCAARRTRQCRVPQTYGCRDIRQTTAFPTRYARTETRVIATDPLARAKFRSYWSIFSPGILLIRRAALGLVKADAERRMRGQLPVRDRFELVSSGDLDPQC